MPESLKEKLVELLSQYFDIGDSYCYNLTRTKNAFACGTMGFDDFEEFDDETVADIADHLIANGVTVQEWISVKDRLPVLHIDDYEEPDGSRVQFEVSEDQWVFTASGHQTKARYETGAVFQGWVGDYGETIRDVTHWMPLLQPPKGE